MKLVETGAHNWVAIPEFYRTNGWQPLASIEFPLGQMGGIADMCAVDFGRSTLNELIAKDTSGVLPRDSTLLQNKPTDGTMFAGAFIVVHTIIDHKPFIVVHRELRENQRTGKYIGDYSVPAETCRPEDVSLLATARRGIFEETGLSEEVAHISPAVLGEYVIHGEGQCGNDLTWVRAYSAFIEPSVLEEYTLASQDRETDSVHLVPPLMFLGAYPARAAARSVVAHWLHSWQKVDAEASPGYHNARVVYKYPSIQSDHIL